MSIEELIKRTEDMIGSVIDTDPAHEELIDLLIDIKVHLMEQTNLP